MSPEWMEGIEMTEGALATKVTGGVAGSTWRLHYGEGELEWTIGKRRGWLKDAPWVRNWKMDDHIDDGVCGGGFRPEWRETELVRAPVEEMRNQLRGNELAVLEHDMMWLVQRGGH